MTFLVWHSQRHIYRREWSYSRGDYFNGERMDWFGLVLCCLMTPGLSKDTKCHV